VNKKTGFPPPYQVEDKPRGNDTRRFGGYAIRLFVKQSEIRNPK